MDGDQRLCDARRKLWNDVRELSLGTNGEIERLEGPPSPLRFLRDFVLPNKPCIIANAIDHWPALSSWSNDYLVDLLRDQHVSVHFTPDGRADSPVHLRRISSVHNCVVNPCSSSDGEDQQVLCGDPEIVDGSASRSKEGDVKHCLVPEKQQPGTRDDGLICEKKQQSRYGNGSVSGRKQRLGCSGLVSEVKKLTHDEKFQNHSEHVETFDHEAHVEEVHVAGHCADNYWQNSDVASKMDSGKHMQLAFSGSGFLSDSDVVVSRQHSAAAVYGDPDDSGYPPDSDTEGERIDHLEIHTDDACHPTDEFWFAMAHIERLRFPEALDLILHSQDGVAYAQEQNGCFLSEYSKLVQDAESHLPWATEALGCMPEAVNLWIGTDKSITSFHKDHYENLYAVISGEKHFTLLPPTDVHRLYVRNYPSAHYTRIDGKFRLQQEKPFTSVPWASVDPYPLLEEVPIARSRFPEYFNGPSPFTCSLHAGEILYLPSMWFHHVRQSPDLEGRIIALNFWYDMQFDIKYAYYNFLESLTLGIQESDDGENTSWNENPH